jgi:hypothetical protein
LKIFRTLTLLIVAIAAISTASFGQAYGSYRDTGGGIVSNQPWCFENTQLGGSLGCAPATLQLTGAQTALTTITTAQTMDSFSLPAGLMNSTSRTLQVCFAGVYTSPGTTAPTLTFALKIGSSVTPISITSAALSTTASTNMPFQGCFDVKTAAIGATGNDEAHGYADVNISANTPAAAVARYLDTNTAVSSNYDHTVANTAVLSIGASLTVTSAQLRYAKWTLLPNK